MTSFENTKSSITGSALGKALSMTSSTSWNDVITKIKGVSNQGAKTSSLNCGGSYTIPAGYHNGSGKITANSLSSQTSATAAAANILSGKTAYVNGSKITGTMANKGNLNWSGSNTTYTVPAGYYSGGTLNSKPSYTNGYNAGHKVINKNGWTTSSSSQYGFKQYDGSGASKYYLTIDMNYTHQILAAAIYTSGYSSKEFYLMTANGFSVKMNESMVIDMTKTHPNWATDRYFYIPVNGSGWSYHYDIWYL